MGNSSRAVIIALGLGALHLALAFSACTATTGTRIPTGDDQLSKIKQIGIVANKDEEFSVRISRDQMTNTGSILGGLVGLGIESSMRSSADTEREDTLKPLIGDFDPTDVLTAKLSHRMHSAAAFRRVLLLKSKDEALRNENGLDSLLEVALRQWGLRRCATSTDVDQVEVALTVHGKVILLDSGNIVWERDEVYREGICHPLWKFQFQDVSIKQALVGAIDNLAGKIVNDILFP